MSCRCIGLCLLLVTSYVQSLIEEEYRGRYKRQTNVVNRACSQNPECGTGAYCSSTKRCACLSTYTNINGYCWLKINPDQGGCSRNEQCSAVWPDAYCSSGTCKCGNNQPSTATRDGRICVNYGNCPVNGQYTKFRAPDGTIFNCGSNNNQLDSICPETHDCVCSDTSCTNQGFCCPTRAFSCVQDVDSGGSGSGGYGFVQRYHHNPVTGNCETFQYRGSGGNANNFQTKDQCESYCQQACDRGNPLYTLAQPGVKGSITYCSSTTSTTVCGNVNYECYTITGGSTSMCCPTVTYVCSPNGGLPYALLGVPSTNYDTGTTQTGVSSSQRWYYDRGLSRCVSFTYLGAGGNFNNFMSESHCSTYCAKSLCTAGQPLKDQSGVNNLNCGTTTCPGTHTCTSSVCCPTKQTVCSQPKGSGSCTSFVNKWWYNPATGNCEEFLYSGCQGNDNRFDTYTDCQAFCRDLRVEPKCIQGTARKDSNGNFIVCQGSTATTTSCPANYQCYYDGSTWGCCPTQAYTCSLSYGSGTQCGGPVVSRWYYNQANRRCETFSYNGCDGNSNNFATQADCEDYCGVGGCPNGGTPYRQNNGQFLPCGTNANTCPTNYMCTSVRIGTLTTSTAGQYCCANREAICRLPRLEGQSCTTSPIQRWFFNSATRNCEQFGFGGCSGNRNNFATRAQCLAYCNSADCPTGQVALADAVTNVMTTCTVGGSCPTNGYTCVQSVLFNTGICCGSSANVDTCPTGMSAFIDSFTTTARTCQPNVNLDCPATYICWYAAKYRQYYCCGTPGQSLCPKGGSPWLNPATNQAQVCTPGNNAACAGAGASYTCETRQVTVNGIVSVTGTCCSPNTVSTVCGVGYTPMQLNNTNVHCHPVTANICKSPATCRQNPNNINEYYCCTGSGPVVTTQVCGLNRTPYTINNYPVICATGTTSLNCPSPYQCVLYSPSNTFYCCGTGAASTSTCPTGSTIYTTNNVVQRCSPNSNPTGCPANYFCQYSSANNGYVCCSSVTTSATQTVASAVNPCPNNLQVARNSLSQPVSCTGSTCTTGYNCVYTTTGNWCCGGGTVTQAPTAGDQYGCPTGRTYLYPNTQLPLTCTSGGTCPSGYTCRTSTRYPGQQQCCSVTKARSSTSEKNTKPQNKNNIFYII